MKPVVKKLSAMLLSLAMVVSLTPFPGGLLLADETDAATPTAAGDTEPEDKKEPEKPAAEKPKETKKPAETAPKETKETEAEAPKETEKQETEAPKEKETTETEAPKETEKPAEEKPAETVPETEAPAETEKPEAEQPKETEATAETEKPAEETPSESAKPEEEIPEETVPEAKNPAESDTEITDIPKTPEATDSKEAKDVPIDPSIMTLNVSDTGIMTWSSNPNVVKYVVTITSDYDETSFDHTSTSLDLNKTIERLIKNGKLEKSYNHVYSIIVNGFDSNGNWLQQGEPTDYKYQTSTTVTQGTIKNISVSQNGIMSWDAYEDADYYMIFIEGYEIDYIESTSINLHAEIDRMIKNDYFSPSSDDKYSIEIMAMTYNGYSTGEGTYTAVYKTNVSPVKPGDITGVDCTNGILTWNSFNDAVRYYIDLDSCAGYSTTTTKHDIGRGIDECITSGYLSRKSQYYIGISAYNSDDDVIAGWSGYINYNSSASYSSLKKISGFKYSKGSLSWSSVSGTITYSLEINDGYNYSNEIQLKTNKIGLNATIDRLIKSGQLSKPSNGKYTIEVRATGKNFRTLAEGSYSIIYKSKATEIQIGFIDDVTFDTDGTMYWKKYPNAAKYLITVECCAESDQLITTNIYNINSRIDWLIKARYIGKSHAYTINISAIDKNGFTIAAWDGIHHYSSNAVPTTPGDIKIISNSQGTLSWDNVGGATKYGVWIGDPENKTYCGTSTSLNIQERIFNLINAGKIYDEPFITVNVFAENNDGIVIAEKRIEFQYSLDFNPMTVSGKTAKVKRKKVRRKNQSVKRTKVISLVNPKGRITYSKVSGNKKIVINASTGNVTVKKKIKKGTYSVRVRVTSAGSAYYTRTVKYVTFKIKVK
ncbi:MAG: hypothetical protein K6E60_03755 [Saccharofermentans sp.]|nr:hypothetical protein [Saccharofermentans sp.]